MHQPDPVFGAEHNRAEVADILGLREVDLQDTLQPQTVSTGNVFCIVALRSLDVLQRLRIPQREASAWLHAHQARWFYCIAQDVAGECWRARMQWGSGEDPATGSAAGPCIAWLVKHELVGSGQVVELRQGVEIQRPSRLFVQATLDGDRVRDVTVAGRTIPVASGQFFLPW